MADTSFALFDCSLVRLATGRSCTNLRELLETLRTAPLSVLEHHLLRCPLEDHFELNEFPNDLARWCWDALGERQLAEELALVNPYVSGIRELRTALVNKLEDRLWALERVPWCRPGFELHLLESRLIAFDTRERFATLASLAEAFPRFSRRSLFFHVHEAHARRGVDDFSAWLERVDGPPTLVERIRGIDFYFLNLNQLRRQLFDAFCAHLSEPQAVLGAVR
ncbi:MAG: hypothetical protein K2Y37_04880 [Pirellulales bacterium]|nr:hypothetical protein [Pirellulales bacterium]